MKNTTILSDEDLIVAYKNGDNKALEVFYKRHRSAVISQVCRIVFNYEMAKDLTQDAFIRFIKYINLNDLPVKKNFKAFVTTIAINLCRDYLRKEKRKGGTYPLFENTLNHQPSSGNESVLESLIKKEEIESLKKNLQRLSAKQRVVIGLRFYLGYSFEEIATMMGEKSVTVRGVRFRSLRILRNIFEEQKNLD